MHTYMRCREEGGGEDKLKITFQSVTRLNLRKFTTMDQKIRLYIYIYIYIHV